MTSARYLTELILKLTDELETYSVVNGSLTLEQALDHVILGDVLQKLHQSTSKVNKALKSAGEQS